ncbi:MAG: tyrosine-type recombinase/integrase [Solirubrobacterales bacterium]
MRRARNLATNTLQSNLIAVKLLYMWSQINSINIERRFLLGDYLNAQEISSLSDAARRPLKLLTQKLSAQHDNVMRFSTVVDSATTAGRMLAIADYLSWLGQEALARHPLDSKSEIGRRLDEFIRNVRIRAPKVGSRNVVGKREAPPQEVIETMLNSVMPGSRQNPWRDTGLQLRNQLLVHLYFGLGIRRAEALGIKTSHLDFRQGKILIARAADDPIDPRKHQPLAKTRDRWLPMGGELSEMIRNYVMHIRAKFTGARRHPFLLISHADGSPLKLTTVNKVFSELRSRVDGLPEDLSPHCLRHAWNDAFSKFVDRTGVPQDREAQLRSELMGWSPTSGTAATYNRRHAREAAKELSLRMQKAMLEND